MTFLGFPHILQYFLKLYKYSETVGYIREAEKNRRQEKNYIRLVKLEIRRGGTDKETLQISVYLCMLYGIVKIGIYSHNKGTYFVCNCHVSSYILLKCAKTREPKDEHCVPSCT